MNTFCLSLRNVKLMGKYPTQDKIDNFLLKSLKIDVRKVYGVTNMRAKQQVLISFIEEKDVIDLEETIHKGIIFPNTNVRVSGIRLDKPTTVARLVGAPVWIEKMDILKLFQRWGEVLSCERGTSCLSAPEGIAGNWSSGWVWSGSLN